MYSPTSIVLWFLAGIAGFTFGIFLASSLHLHQPLYIFSLATIFSAICLMIAFKFTQFYIRQLSGRMFYVSAAFILLAALIGSALLLIGVY